MRIVGGRLRGRALEAPKSQAIRPTADRLRESLFNILVHAYGNPVVDARVLDLFAGTGALGFEALSAARRSCCSSMTAPRRARCCAATSRRWARAARPRCIAATPRRLGPVSPLEPFSLAFLDPPYGKGLAEQALAAARDGGGCAGRDRRGRGGGRRGVQSAGGVRGAGAAQVRQHGVRVLARVLAGSRPLVPSLPPPRSRCNRARRDGFGRPFTFDDESLGSS